MKPNHTIRSLMVLLSMASLSAQDSKQGNSLEFPERIERQGAPLLTCTPSELARLRKAYSAGKRAVTQVVSRARRRLSEKLVFPPRGGQHNQWYQCEKCQLGLQTLSATKHRCPKCKTVYSGPPYDDVIFSKVHGRNWARAREAAWAYALTGEKAFAEDAKRIVLGYAERYEKYPYHTNSRGGLRKGSGGGHIKEQSLSEASLMIDSIIPSCDLLWPSLTQAERDQISQHLIRPMLDNLGRAPRGKSNWQSFHNAAMFAGGALIGDLTWMRRSIFHRTNGFLFQMKRCVSDEGMWFENSWGYHLYTLRALTAHAEFARRCGIDLWHQGPLQKMVELPFAYAMPDGSLPRFGDDVNSRVSSRSYFIQAARSAFDSPQLRRMAQGPATWNSILHGNKAGPTIPPTQTESRLFRSAGHAILRSPGEKGLSSAFTFGPFGGFHGHFDKLSFVLFAFGREFGVDPGRARSQAYRLPIHKLWYRGTISHNAIVVDGKSQRGTRGQLLLFSSTKRYEAVAARVDGAYKQLRHARCLIQTEDYLLVLDDLRSAGPERRFDWIYHNRSASVRCDQATQETQAGETVPSKENVKGKLGMSGERFVELQSTGSTKGPIHALFADPRFSLSLHVAASPSQTGVFLGTGTGQSVVDRVPMIILRRKGKEAFYACLLEPRRTEGQSSILSLTVSREDGLWLIGVQTAQGRVGFTWDGDRKLEANSGR